MHVQRIIDHLAEDPDVVFFMVVDKNGKIIAHNNHARIGTMTTVPELKQAENIGDGPQQLFSIIKANREFGRVFETIRSFTLVFPSLLPFPPPRPFTKDLQPFFFHPPSRGNHPLFHFA